MTSDEFCREMSDWMHELRNRNYPDRDYPDLTLSNEEQRTAVTMVARAIVHLHMALHELRKIRLEMESRELQIRDLVHMAFDAGLECPYSEDPVQRKQWRDAFSQTIMLGTADVTPPA